MAVGVGGVLEPRFAAAGSWETPLGGGKCAKPAGLCRRFGLADAPTQQDIQDLLDRGFSVIYIDPDTNEEVFLQPPSFQGLVVQDIGL